ncbi:MAG: hypothetical protein Q8N35_01190 [Methylococcaceae bacterium]|nr:hypothetical protein [Methylococcaceae bacterium]MDZ4156464.1 hypothetical protein [Methylococcales bacterium]MDP2391680.1 hypothetical protein [Methylococcaceae bacterium]MDP3018179.1 hypothetical protein [Methylococcaceae bacterium]MDP3389392.1 hypothetical protein [Methylococcaceae bacterium]
MNKKPCTHEYLAATEFGKALICRDCGVVHLHIRNMSLHFEIAEFLGLADTLTEASNQARAGQKDKNKRAGFTVVKSNQRLN